MTTAKHDWYVFDKGQVKGPYSADILQKLDMPKEAMVSRKGLQQWYPVDHLVQILKTTGAMSDATQSAMSEFSKVVDASLNRVQAKAPAVGEVSVQAKTIAVPKKQKEESKHAQVNTSVNSLSDTIQGQSSVALNQDKKLSRKQKKKLQRQQEYEARKARRHKGEGTTESNAMPSADTQVDLDELYLLLRGRLRLGKIHFQPMTSIALYIFSFGLSMIGSMDRQYQEASFHVSGAAKKLGWMRFWAPLPILCVLPALRLHSLVKAMESQNKYAHISRAGVVVGCVFPPFAQLFIQGALNRHWYLHTSFAAQTNLKDLVTVGSRNSAAES